MSSEQKAFRWMCVAGMLATLSLAAFGAHEFWIGRILAPHVAAGGVDDPDVAIPRWHLFPLFAELGCLLIGSLAFLICMVWWLSCVQARKKRLT